MANDNSNEATQAIAIAAVVVSLGKAVWDAWSKNKDDHKDEEAEQKASSHDLVASLMAERKDLMLELRAAKAENNELRNTDKRMHDLNSLIRGYRIRAQEQGVTWPDLDQRAKALDI